MNQNASTELAATLPLEEAAEHICCRQDFVAFAGSLLADLRQQRDRWENADLTSYLEAMAAWVNDMPGYYKNRGEPVPDQPSWKTLARILLAARTYE